MNPNSIATTPSNRYVWKCPGTQSVLCITRLIAMVPSTTAGITPTLHPMQDTDILRNGAPILHWTMVDIPATTTKLAAGMSEAPAGTMYGPNIRGTMQPYMGPRTPAGPKHRYHIQVFALDTSVGNESMQSYDAMLAAMGMFGVGALRLPRWARERREQMEAVAMRLLSSTREETAD